MSILYFLVLRPLCILQMLASLLPNSFILSFNKFLNTYCVRGLVVNTRSILAHKNRPGLSEQIMFWEAALDTLGESEKFYLCSCLPHVR